MIDAPTLQESEAQNLIQTTQHTLDDLNEFSPHHLRLTLGSSITSEKKLDNSKATEKELHEAQRKKVEPALTVKLSQNDGVQTVSTELRPHSTILDVYYATNQISSSSSSSSVLANAIANKLLDLFSEEQASIAYILTSNPAGGNNQYSSSTLGQAPLNSQSASASSREQRPGLSRALSPEFAAKLARRTTRSLKYAPTYHITISLFSATDVPNSWDIRNAVNDHLMPLLELFSISNFTVDTQVQLYATFAQSAAQPEFDAAQKVWTLKSEDLSGFINAAEWPLGPSIGEGPTLNFVLYIPDEKMTPLVVRENHASSWLIPQWGGVTILNSKGKNSQTSDFLSGEEIRPALMTFSHQLLALLGAPDTPSSFPLQLQTLIRVQAASLLLSASSTMGSLARLTKSLPNIPIPENVARGVDDTLLHLRETCSSLREGRFHEALEHARIAEVEAEKVFFEKSMVGQVYFPDEHKIAVYLPLLGPIGVPLITSLLKEVKKLRKPRSLSP